MPTFWPRLKRITVLSTDAVCESSPSVCSTALDHRDGAGSSSAMAPPGAGGSRFSRLVDEGVPAVGPGGQEIVRGPLALTPAKGERAHHATHPSRWSSGTPSIPVDSHNPPGNLPAVDPREAEPLKPRCEILRSGGGLSYFESPSLATPATAPNSRVSAARRHTPCSLAGPAWRVGGLGPAGSCWLAELVHRERARAGERRC